EVDAFAGARPPVQRNHSRLVHDFVTDCYDARSLHNLVRVAVNEWQHRSGEPSRDASIEQAEILWAIERPSAEAAAAARPLIHEIQGIVIALESSARFCSQCRDVAVGWIDDEPRPAAFGNLEDVSKLVGADTRGTIEDLLLAFFENGRQLCSRQILVPST